MTVRWANSGGISSTRMLFTTDMGGIFPLFKYAMHLHCKNEGAVPTPFVVSSLCECDTWCSPNTPGCHTSTLGCHLSTLGCHCSTHGVTLAPLGCHHSTKSWCHIRTHMIFNSVVHNHTLLPSTSDSGGRGQVVVTRYRWESRVSALVRSTLDPPLGYVMRSQQ